MAEAVARQLRDGVALGEQAPAVMVRDTLDTRAGPSIFDHLFSSLCSNIEAGRAQAKYAVSHFLVTWNILLLLVIFRAKKDSKYDTSGFVYVVIS